MRKVPPTKSSLMALKRELSFASLGHELLDQKRSILVLELLNLVDQAVDFEEQVRNDLAKAYDALARSSLRMGRLRVSRVAHAVDIQSSIELDQRTVMGVRLPQVDTTFVDNSPYVSHADTSFWLDRTIDAFKDALERMGKLAELKVSIMRLAREVKKTIRKVNALEKIAIPDLKETVVSIEGRLEESERDMYILMKMVKERLNA